MKLLLTTAIWLALLPVTQLVYAQSGDPIVSAVEPVETTSDPVEPVPDPVEPSPDPVEPAPDPVEPAPDPVEPAPDPVEPAPDPVEPAPDPVEPAPDPVEPGPDPSEVPAPPPQEPPGTLPIDTPTDTLQVPESSGTTADISTTQNQGVIADPATSTESEPAVSESPAQVIPEETTVPPETEATPVSQGTEDPPVSPQPPVIGEASQTPTPDSGAQEKTQSVPESPPEPSVTENTGEPAPDPGSNGPSEVPPEPANTRGLVAPPTEGENSASNPEPTSPGGGDQGNPDPDPTDVRSDEPNGAGGSSSSPTDSSDRDREPSNPSAEESGAPDGSPSRDGNREPTATNGASPDDRNGNTGSGSRPTDEASPSSRGDNGEVGSGATSGAQSRGSGSAQETSRGTGGSGGTARVASSSQGNSRATGSSSSLAPLSTGVPTSGTGFSGVDIAEFEESTEKTPPDTTTPEQHEAEAEANLPFTAISAADAQDIAAREAAMFEYFVQNDPQIGDDEVTIPAAASDCSIGLAKRSLTKEGRWWGGFVPPTLKPRAECTIVTNLEFDLHFHYMLPTKGAERPNQLSERITDSVVYLQSVFGLRAMNFTYVDTNFYTPDEDDGDWTTVRYKEDRLETWMTETRKGDTMSLNVWLVNDLKMGSGDDEKDINEYATFPEDRSGGIDGIVMRQAHVNDVAPTLVHNIGHWLGLRHTFSKQIEDGEEDCVADTGLLSSTQTSGSRSVIYNCSQVPCSGTSTRNITNFMSYSSCRGDTTGGGFSIDQKAAIFARVIQFRRTNSDDECEPTNTDTAKSAVQKRSSMQDLVDGVCPNITEEAERIQKQPVNHAPAMAIHSWGWFILWLAGFMAVAM